MKILVRRRVDDSKGKGLIYCSFERARNSPDNDPLETYILESFREQESPLLVPFLGWRGSGGPQAV